MKKVTATHVLTATEMEIPELPEIIKKELYIKWGKALTGDDHLKMSEEKKPAFHDNPTRPDHVEFSLTGYVLKHDDMKRLREIQHELDIRADRDPSSHYKEIIKELGDILFGPPAP